MKHWTPCLVASRLLAMLFVVAVAACRGTQSLSDLPVIEVTGHYTVTSDGQWFHKCTSGADDPAWWVTFTDQAVAQRATGRFAALLQSGEPLFVRWNASLGDRDAGAPDGPGPGRRYILVREILDVRVSEPNDCSTSR